MILCIISQVFDLSDLNDELHIRHVTEFWHMCFRNKNLTKINKVKFQLERYSYHLSNPV